ncbi:hypothetical protein M153_11380001, partial [Pseudoloma neurophilia]
ASVLIIALSANLLAKIRSFLNSSLDFGGLKWIKDVKVISVFPLP